MQKMMNGQYLSKVTALLIGGASRLGAATARHIVANGERVLIADLPNQVESFQRMQFEMNHGGRMNFCGTDITNERQVEMALNEVSNMYWEEISACINCGRLERRCRSRKHFKRLLTSMYWDRLM